MRLSARLERLFTRLQPVGWLAVLAMLALSSPGVVTEVRAEPPVSSVPAGPSCDLAQQEITPALQAEQLVEAARRRAGSDPEVVVLNNRGYRYGNTAPEADVDELIQQLIRQQKRGGQ